MIRLKRDNNFQGEPMSLFTQKGYLHGGRRTGAGRPKTSRREQHGIRVTPEEWQAVQNLLATMRGKKEQTDGEEKEGKSGVVNSRPSGKH